MLRRTMEFPRIDSLDNLTRHEAVKHLLSDMILKDRWPVGTVLPSEVALAKMFGVAVGTVRRALTDLAADGLVMRRRKTGTVVIGQVPLHNLNHFFRYFRLHGRDGSIVRSRTRLLSRDIRCATPDEARILKLEPGKDGVLHLHRLRLVHDRPVMHEWLTLPTDRLRDFPGEDDMPELLYRFLLEQYGIRVTVVRERTSADLATAQDREILELPDPSAVMVLEELSFDQAGAPIIIATHRANTADFVYINELR